MGKPKIRFKGYEDDWEQRKLGEVAQEFKSGNSLKADEIDITGDYPVYGGNGLRGYTSTYNHDGEYALIGRQGALCGNMNYSVGKAYFTEHAVVVKADENNDTRFLYYMLDTMNLGQYSDQSAQPGLAVNKLVKLENQFPMKEEQQRIGWYFSNIDHLITLHQRKCYRFIDIALDAWEQRKWIDVVDISTEMVNPTTGEYDNMPHIAPGNIESFTGRILDNVKTVKEEQLISGKFRFRPDDVVYGKINPQLGKYFYATVNGLTSADAYVFNGKNGLKQKFLFALLQTSDFFKYSVSVSKRSGMPKINRDELNAYSFLMPSEEEQDRIGSYLLQLDHLITLHQRKCEETKSLKKYMLQKMFPENGNCVPKIRFSGFADAWEQRKLKDYLEVSREKNKTESYGKEDVLSVSGEHGIVNQIEFQGRSFAGVSVANYGVVEAGDVVYTKSPLKSNPYGIIKTNKGKTGIVSTLYAVYKPRMNTNSEFVQIYFELDSRMNSYMHPLVNKGAKNDMKVSDENALKGPVAFPELEEQNAITQYFDKLDRLITLHQHKCDELQKLKKFMLQNMFV